LKETEKTKSRDKYDGKGTNDGQTIVQQTETKKIGGKIPFGEVKI